MTRNSNLCCKISKIFCLRLVSWEQGIMTQQYAHVLKNVLPKNTSLRPLRQDPPPLDLSFWSFLTFLHYGIEEVQTHLRWKFHKKIQRKSWSNVPPKLLACIGFLYKVVHKTAVSESSIALARLNLTFLPFGLSPWNLAHLFIMFLATKHCLKFFNFCLGT